MFIADSVPNPLRELQWARSKWKKGKDGFIYFLWVWKPHC